MKKTPLTYDELLAKLLTLSPEQLKQTVTVYDSVLDEYFPTVETATANSRNNDVLDNGHFYLVF